MSIYFDLFTRGFNSLRQMELAELSYQNTRLAIFIAVMLCALIVSSWILARLRRQEYTHNYSGHNIDRKYRQGLIVRFAHFTPKILFAGAIGLFLIALADPFFNRSSEQVQVTNSRVRVDARDISGSMTDGIFPGTTKKKARVAVEAHLQFLKMRQGKHDRSSLWLFGSHAYKIEDFISDDELYYQTVEDAYWGIWSGSYDQYYTEESTQDYGIPQDKLLTMQGESGGTNVVHLLQSVIEYYDNDAASRNAKNRSVLIISDAEVESDPSAQLAELKKRNIIPFLMFVRSSESSLPSFVNQIESYGGKYFDIMDESAIKKAFIEIDKLESVNIQRSVTLTRVPLYQVFLLSGIALFMFATVLATTFELFGVYP